MSLSPRHVYDALLKIFSLKLPQHSVDLRVCTDISIYIRINCLESSSLKWVWNYRRFLAKTASSLGIPNGHIEIRFREEYMGECSYIPSLDTSQENAMKTLIIPESPLYSEFADYRKELQDRQGVYFGVSLIEDRNIAVSPDAIVLMGKSEAELLGRDLRRLWQLKDNASPTEIAINSRPKSLKSFICLLKQQSVLENHRYQGYKNDILGEWIANIRVREILPFHYVREHEALEFIPTSM